MLFFDTISFTPFSLLYSRFCKVWNTWNIAIAVLKTLLWQLRHPAISGSLSADCSLLILLWHGLRAIFFFTCSVIVFFIETWPLQRCPFKNIASFGLYSLGHLLPKCQCVKGLVLSLKLSEVVEMLEVQSTERREWNSRYSLSFIFLLWNVWFCFATCFCQDMLPQKRMNEWARAETSNMVASLLASPNLIFFSLQYIRPFWITFGV